MDPNPKLPAAPPRSTPGLRLVFTGAFSILLALPALAAPSGAKQTREHLVATCRAEGYTFTPKVRAAFLGCAKAEAIARLREAGQSLPEEFLSWVDSDPEIASGVFAAHPRPEQVLLWLYSLRLDLGSARFETYRHLALASALMSAKEGLQADISPRAPLKLVIAGDPRVPVDTRDKGRKLDVNDHIINFLNEHTVEDVVPVGKIEPPELKYDERGIAIPAPPENRPAKPAPRTEKRTRTLYAADVLASRELQDKFNSYMKSKGHEVVIECGERVVHWNSKDAVHGEQRKKIEAAYRLFRTAYESKGLLPPQRDPFPSPAERCAYLIRNFEYEFPPELQAKRKWPLFPLTAPWPVLTMLAADRQPLREREERWIAYRDRGEFHQYGEYIGAIAQQFSMQSARRLKPYPFSYATVQMMLKDGGVCGTMGSIAARGGNTLGIPSCQATQPGHCAVASFQFDAKTGTYQCKGAQYATGGDDKTGPFTPWPFTPEIRRINRTSGHEIEFHQRQPMIYHQSIAWGVNYGLREYLDATIAHATFQLLPDAERRTGGMRLLNSAIALNPYHFLVVDAAQASARTPQEHIAFWNQLSTALATTKEKAGCPREGLYNTTVTRKMTDRLSKMPVPEAREDAAQVLKVLEEIKCEEEALLARYRGALKGN